MENNDLARSLPVFIKVWFFLDFIICCAPPIYLTFGTTGGMPAFPLSIVYFIFCGVFITSSIIIAEFMKA